MNADPHPLASGRRRDIEAVILPGFTSSEGMQ
jgi:hypothetical protein